MVGGSDSTCGAPGHYVCDSGRLSYRSSAAKVQEREKGSSSKETETDCAHAELPWWAWPGTL